MARQTRGVSGFVGRHGELGELAGALERAVAGAGALFVVSGEAGIGKTRLCEEVAGAAAARGVTVAWARCWEAGTVRGLGVWDELLRRLDEGDLPHGGGGEGSERELFGRVVDAVRQASAHRPLLLVVDDLHWADVASARLLAHLAASLREIAVIVLATVRDGEVDAGSPLGDAIVDLVRYGRHVTLAGLSPAEVADLVREVGVEVDAGAVYHHTRGNPLFAQELARLLGTDAYSGRVASGDMPPVPDTIRGVLTRRLRQLSPACRSVLDTAAVVGDLFSLAVVEAVMSIDRDSLLEHVGEAAGARVLREAGVGVYGFAHPLVRATLYDELGVARRVRLHERVGLAMEGMRATGQDVDLAALAHHFVHAAPGGAAGRAVAYAVEAAEAAMGRFAYESAIQLYSQALGAAELDPSGTDRCPLLLGLGASEAAAGRMPEARGHYVQAADLARAAGRADQLARAALGLAGGGGFEVRLADREQIDLLEEARVALGEEHPALRSRVAARLSVALSLAGVDERRRALAEEAVGLARAGDDRAALASALAAHCDVVAGPDGTELRMGESTEIVALATAIGDRGMELLGRRLRLVALLELGHMAEADAEIEAFARLVAVIRQPLYAWFVPLWRGMRALARGQVAACQSLLEQATRLGAEAHSDNAWILTESLHWYLARESGDVETPLRMMDGVLAQEPVLGAQLRVSATLMIADAGRHAEARARLDADAAAIRAVPVDSEWVPLLAQLAQAIAQIGGHSLAGWAYDALLPHRRLFGVEGIGAAWSGSVERALGLLAGTLGRREEAAAHFDAALAANRTAGSPLYVARTLRDWGLSLDDRERVTAAGAAYGELGLERRVAELEAWLAEKPVPSANVFRREGEVWALGYAGTMVRLKDVKGMRDLAYLLARPGREVAAVDLAGPPEGPRQGDLGGRLDARATAAYKARLAELETTLEEADAAGDAERSAQAIDERDAIARELAAAYGLGGRPRRTGDSVERARQAVTWRIRDALGRIDSAHPELGRHLRRSVRTGTFCAYDPADAPDWSL